MAETAADVLIESILDWGIDTVFGLPGDGINGIMEALRTRQDRVRFIQVRHEESAAFMACAGVADVNDIRNVSMNLMHLRKCWCEAALNLASQSRLLP